MRGAREPVAHVLVAAGIIPAYAGSTAEAKGEIIRVEDHPRVCGEHRVPVVRAQVQRGSSPRMRGAHLNVVDVLDPCGIIPAYAGSTMSRDGESWECEDHPRVCGEHVRLAIDNLRYEGSSPRMRGALRHLLVRVDLGGIIPAYAGSTCRVTSQTAFAGDHPRVCGEHPKGKRDDTLFKGSSPRMRGARWASPGNVSITRIIPAYAGSTQPIGTSNAILQDHPRVCGEHYRVAASASFLAGSSPRMRGAQVGR